MYTWLCIWFHLGKLGLKATTHPLPKENANQHSTVKAIGVGEGSEEVEEASSSHPFKLGRLKTLKMDITFCFLRKGSHALLHLPTSKVPRETSNVPIMHINDFRRLHGSLFVPMLAGLTAPATVASLICREPIRSWSQRIRHEKCLTRPPPCRCKMPGASEVSV